MKKNILIIIIAVVVVLAGALCYSFEKGLISIPQMGQEAEQAKLVNDDFEMTLPSGWKQSQESMGAIAMANNPDEKIDDPAAEKVGFKSYLAVSYDGLAERDMSGYMNDMKSELSRLIANISLGEEKDLTVNGRPAKSIELEMDKEGAMIKAMIVAVEGKNKDVWMISFDTTKNSWEKYKQSFLDSVNTFTLKK